MMEDRLQLRGTHGTTRTRASAIMQSSTFKVSERGYAGRGAYFWSYASDESFGIDLAECWWAFALYKKHYADDPDKSCSVLGVCIDGPEDGKLLDATLESFKDAIYKIMRDNNRSADDLPEVTAVLVEEMEAANGAYFDVVKIRINNPPVVKGRKQSFAQMVARESDAYLVKENGLHLINEIRIMREED